MIDLVYAGGDHVLRTDALRSGEAEVDGCRLNYLVLGVAESMSRMLRFDEFDACELSLGAFLSLVASGDRRFVGLPVFPARYFRHRHVYVNAAAGIGSAAEIACRRVGVADYHQTAALWIRAFLLHDFGVTPESVHWVRGGLDRPVRLERLGRPLPAGIEVEDAAPGRSLADLLIAGEIDALLAPRQPAAFVGNPAIRRLFPDYRTVERSYYLRTGIFPIMHVVVVRRPLYERHPQIAIALLEAFIRSKWLGMVRVADPTVAAVSHPWWETRLDETQSLFGGDPYPYGVEANHAVLEHAVAYALEQGLVDRPVAVRELFAAETLAHPGG